MEFKKHYLSPGIAGGDIDAVVKQSGLDKWLN